MRGMHIVFAGTPEFAATTLQALFDQPCQLDAVLTQPDRPAGRGRRLRPSPVKQLAERRGITVLQPQTLRDSAISSTLRALAPDLMIVVAYGLILPEEVLAIPRLGCINIHASLLPRWRGAAPLQRALLAGDTETGVTIIQMDKGMDTGAMLERRTCPILPGDTAGALHDRLAALGAKALCDTLPRIAAGAVQAQAQEAALATYAPKIDKAEAWLDWERPAAELERKVRAFNPWPVAWTTIPGYGRVRIWRAFARVAGAPAPPGVIVRADKTGIEVATGEGVLLLEEIQLSGGRVQGVGHFLNAHALRAGMLLGR